MEYIVDMKNITKDFGGVRALNNVDFSVKPGEIMALVGDNGAGKSTLVKLLSGVHQPTSGQIFYKGEKVNIKDPRQSRKLGIETIYQELALVEDFTVAQNLFLGKELKKSFLGMKIFDRQKMREEARKIFNRLNISMPKIKKRVYYLSGGQRQSIAISRAVYSEEFSDEDIDLLIMDEPTAALGVEESQKVKELIKYLKEDKNLSIIVISHNMEDVFDLADRITVLSRGALMGTRVVNEVERDDIIKMIMGMKDVKAS